MQRRPYDPLAISRKAQHERQLLREQMVREFGERFIEWVYQPQDAAHYVAHFRRERSTTGESMLDFVKRLFPGGGVMRPIPGGCVVLRRRETDPGASHGTPKTTA